MKHLKSYVFTLPILIGFGLAASGYGQGLVLVQFIMWPLVIVGQLYWVALFDDEARVKLKDGWDLIPIGFKAISYTTFVITLVCLTLFELYVLLGFFILMMLAVMLIRNSKN